MNHKILLHLLSAILLCISAKAESTSEGEATSLTWERTWLDAVQLKWQPPTQVQSSMLDIPINDWEPAFGFNMNSNNTVTDGYRIYSGSNLLQVYDMQGNYLETIEIPGLPEIYQMTYDGKYFYGTVYERPGIFVIDLTNKKLVKVIPTKESMYHIAYIPQLDENKGGFFVGNPGRGWFCDMEGNMLNDYGSIDIQKDLGDGRFCMAAATIGEKLYIYSVKTTDRILYEYDLNTLTPTGNSFNLDDFTGMAGVETPMAGRHMFVYNYPDNKRYLMLTDYNGLKFRSTSVLTGERPLIAGLEGYNIYRNNIKINEAPIDANTWSFNDSGLEEATDYIYELRPIIEGKEQPSIARANISLDNTTTLPLLDDFSAHTLTQIHPTLQLPVNYWTIAPKLPEQKWVIYGAGDQRLQFSYSPDLKYRQTITTRPLYAQEGKNIKINIGYTGNTYLYTLPQTEGMSIDVSVDNGETWQSAGTIQYKADADKFSTAEFDLTSLVAGKKFQVRFKGYGEEPDSPYNWQFNDVKIWEYNDIDITGKINISGVSDMTNLNISLTNLDTTSETITETDNAGNFSVSNMQSGTYRLRVFNNDYTYTIDQYTFDESGNYYQIHIPQGYFQSDANPIEATVAPGDNYEIALPLQNAGDVEANILMSFDYTANGGQPIGNSDIKAEINWIPNTDFNYPQNQSSFFYFGGFLYSKSESYMATQIIRHSIDGELLETITLKPEGDFTTQPAGYFVKGDDLYAYTTPIS